MVKKTKKEVMERVKKIQEEYFKTKNLYWKHCLYGQTWGTLFNCSIDFSKDKKMNDDFDKMCKECNPRQLDKMFRLKYFLKRLIKKWSLK